MKKLFARFMALFMPRPGRELLPAFEDRTVCAVHTRVVPLRSVCICRAGCEDAAKRKAASDLAELMFSAGLIQFSLEPDRSIPDWLHMSAEIKLCMEEKT